MLIRTRILARILVLATTAVIQLPSQLGAADNDQAPNSYTSTLPTASNTEISEPILDPAGIYGADDELEQEILDAIDLYTNAGLGLPELRIYVHDSYEACDGNLGLYSKGGDQHRVDICEWDPKLISHELAHAWEYHNVDDATRQAYLDRARLKVWNSHDVPHPARGVERVAFVISWGVVDQPIQIMTKGHYTEELYQYELLTGMPSPRIAHLDAAPQNPTQQPTRPNVSATDGVVLAIVQ